MSDNQWLQDDEGRWQRATNHHMGRRLPTWDYKRPGSYVITIVLADRRSNALGELFVKAPGTEDKWLTIEEAKALKLPPEAVEAKIVFSELGKAIFKHFQRMGEFTPGLKPVYCAIMPDHIHLLIKVEAELERPIGNAIGGFKTGCEKIFAEMGGEGRLFAPGFVDEIVLRAGQIASEFNYLRDNPRRLAVKRLYPDLFKYSRRLAVNLRLAPQGPARQRAPQGLAGQGAAMVSPAPMAWFSAIGNHFLLDRPLAQVQVSRHYFRYKREPKPGGGLKIVRDANGEPLVELASREYEARRDELMAAAKRGVALLSPCISDGERQIAHEALVAGYRLVTMRNKGFSTLQKPGGRYFDACAEGRLLMLAPAAWPYQPGEKQMTRVDATAMNRLCQWLAGDGAADVNYHGLKPANIDATALAACAVVSG